MLVRAVQRLARPRPKRRHPNAQRGVAPDLDEALLHAKPMRFGSTSSAPDPTTSLLQISAEHELHYAYNHIQGVLASVEKGRRVPFLELVEATSAVLIRLALDGSSRDCLTLLSHYLRTISPLSHTYAIANNADAVPPFEFPLSQTSFVQPHLLPPPAARAVHVALFSVRLIIRNSAASGDLALAAEALRTLAAHGIGVDANIVGELSIVASTLSVEQARVAVMGSGGGGGGGGGGGTGNDADSGTTSSLEAFGVVAVAALSSLGVAVEATPSSIDGCVRLVHTLRRELARRLQGVAAAAASACGSVPLAVSSDRAPPSTAAFIPSHHSLDSPTASSSPLPSADPRATRAAPPPPALADGGRAVVAVLSAATSPTYSVSRAAYTLPPVAAIVRAISTLVGRPLPPAACGVLKGPPSARPAVESLLRTLRVACDHTVFAKIDPAIPSSDPSVLSSVDLPPGWWRCTPSDDSFLDVVSRGCAALGPGGCADALEINVELMKKSIAPSLGALVDPVVTLMGAHEDSRAALYVDMLLEVVCEMLRDDEDRRGSGGSFLDRGAPAAEPFVRGVRVGGVDVDVILSMLVAVTAACGAEYDDCERRIEAAVRGGIPHSCVGPETRFQLAVAACRTLQPDTITAQLDAALGCAKTSLFIPPSFTPGEAASMLRYFTPSGQRDEVVGGPSGGEGARREAGRDTRGGGGGRFQLTAWHYGALYAAYCSGGFYRDASGLLNEMIGSGVTIPDDVASFIITASAGRGDVTKVLQSHREKLASAARARGGRAAALRGHRKSTSGGGGVDARAARGGVDGSDDAAAAATVAEGDDEAAYVEGMDSGFDALLRTVEAGEDGIADEMDAYQAPPATLSIRAFATLGHVPALIGAVRAALKSHFVQRTPLDVALPLRDACEFMRTLSSLRSTDAAVEDASALLPILDGGGRVYGPVPDEDAVESPCTYTLLWLEWLTDAGYPPVPELVSYGLQAAAVEGRLEDVDRLLSVLHKRGDSPTPEALSTALDAFRTARDAVGALHWGLRFGRLSLTPVVKGGGRSEGVAAAQRGIGGSSSLDGGRGGVMVDAGGGGGGVEEGYGAMGGGYYGGLDNEVGDGGGDGVGVGGGGLYSGGGVEEGGDMGVGGGWRGGVEGPGAGDLFGGEGPDAGGPAEWGGRGDSWSGAHFGRGS